MQRAAISARKHNYQERQQDVSSVKFIASNVQRKGLSQRGLAKELQPTAGT